MSLFDNFSPEDIDLLPYPAYFLNEDRVVIHRNKNAKPSRLAVRVRSRIDNYISVQDKKRIIALKVGEEIFVDLFFEPAYGAIICKVANGYLVAVRHITAHMMSHITKIAKYIPPFFSNIMGQIESLRLATFQSREEMVKVRHQYFKVLRYQTTMARYFEYIAGKYSRDKVCEISTPMLNLLNEAAAKLRPNGVDLSLHVMLENVYVKASSYDFRYAVASLLSVAAENTFDGRIRIESTVIEGEYLFKIVYNPRVDDQTYDGMLEGYYGGELLNTIHGNLFFDLLMVQMLAEGSGWKFSINEVGCSRGVLSMSLFVPLAEEDPSLLNCAPDSQALLEMMLVNVLGPQFSDPIAL